MIEKEIYSWHDFDEDMNKIAAWARPHKFKNVYGMPRGGLVPAVKLSHLLDIHLILHPESITSDTLVIDDIIDRGDTLHNFFISIGRSCRFVSIFFNEDSFFEPAFFVRKKKYWVIFPWETDATSRYDGTI